AAHIRFGGRLERPELLALLRTARCLVQPSVCEDPNPLAVIEAAAVGVPCIGSRAGGIPEAVTDDTGALVPPGDVEALAAALADTHAHPDRWVARGHAARRRYEERFSPAAAWASLVDAYGRVGVDAADRRCAG
ncbi:MAG: glycosyltransferase, partial [Gemmatimonadales bacterium]